MKHSILFMMWLLAWFPGVAQIPAFKGAEGFGATASGGRGKEVYHVTNLKDSGPGSFRDAVSTSGRTVVFDVGGVIKLESRVAVMSDITIAGQTAPGAGITLYGESVAFNKISNVIVRYIRLHGSINMKRGSCVLVADSSDHIIFDHLSITWGRWDDLHIKGSKNITMQYCLIGESLDPQRFGALLERPEYISIHHCLWISNQSRNPKAKAKIEYINNVVYNWGVSGFVGGHSSADHYQDIINNYFIAGPSSTDHFLSMFTATDHVYHSGNYIDLDKDATLNGRSITDTDFSTGKLNASITKEKQLAPVIPVTTETADKAFYKIMSSSGCSIERDPVDRRLIAQLSGLGQEGEIIWTETMVGGQPKMEFMSVTLADTDLDGIPDLWERNHGLNANKASDASQIQKSGYTHLEDYFEDLLKN